MSDILRRLNLATTIATTLDDAGTPASSMAVGYTMTIHLDNDDDAPAVAAALDLTEEKPLVVGDETVRTWSGVVDGQPVAVFGARTPKAVTA